VELDSEGRGFWLAAAAAAAAACFTCTGWRSVRAASDIATAGVYSW